MDPAPQERCRPTGQSAAPGGEAGQWRVGEGSVEGRWRVGGGSVEGRWRVGGGNKSVSPGRPHAAAHGQSRCGRNPHQHRAARRLTVGRLADLQEARQHSKGTTHSHQLRKKLTSAS